MRIMRLRQHPRQYVRRELRRSKGPPLEDVQASINSNVRAHGRRFRQIERNYLEVNSGTQIPRNIIDHVKVQHNNSVYDRCERPRHEHTLEFVVYTTT